MKRKNIKNVNARRQNQENITKCDKCNYEFYLKAVNIHKEKITLNNTIVDLVYFACPNCSKIYRISIQDARYYDLKEDLERAKKRMRKNQGSNDEEKARVLHSMVVRKHERLVAHVTKVNKMFPGTFVFEASENNPEIKTIKYLP